MKWSRDGSIQSTFGAAGPARPSVLPVRCGLPRYVVHGSVARADRFTTKAQRTQRRHTEDCCLSRRRMGSLPLVFSLCPLCLCGEFSSFHSVGGVWSSIAARRWLPPTVISFARRAPDE